VKKRERRIIAQAFEKAYEEQQISFEWEATSSCQKWPLKKNSQGGVTRGTVIAISPGWLEFQNMWRDASGVLVGKDS